MARTWKEQFDSTKRGGLPDSMPDVLSPIRRHLRGPTMSPHEVIFVSVSSFTFRFDTKEQLQRVLRYYEQKTVPSTASLSPFGDCVEATTARRRDGSRNCPFSFGKNRNASRL